MKLSKKAYAILLAAIAAPLALSSSASAQFKVDQEGRARDANNRIGSGGYNTRNVPESSLINGNQIITGNVTGGREFRGGVNYTDPREFRGGVAGTTTDNFIKGSSGVPQSYQPNNFNRAPEQFYGRAMTGGAPPGFVQNMSSGTFTRDPNAPTNPFGDNSIDSRVLLPRPGDLLMPGPLNTQTNMPMVVAASPLLGVRQFNLDDANDRKFMLNFTSMRQENSLERLNLDVNALAKMRDELASSVDEADRILIDQASGKTEPGKVSAAVVKPFESVENVRVGGERVNTGVKSGVTNDARPEMYSQFVVPNSAQSAQYAELETRLNRYYTDRLAGDEVKNREFLTQLRTREASEAARKIKPPEPSNGTPDKVKPADGTKPKTAAPPPDYNLISRDLFKDLKNPDGTLKDPRDLTKALTKPKPVKIDSLATGVKAEGLARTLQKAEDLMRQGKFTSALDQYDLASAIAPNNSLVFLGQANAELAAGYFRRAEIHLRTALVTDPVLTMAQFDLKSWIGQDRLDALVKDLKEVARTNTRDSGSPLLLAYVAYNTGNEKQAAVYLDLAQKRAADDELYRLLWTHWAIPDDALPKK